MERQTAGQLSVDGEKLAPEVLLEVYQAQWNDIHHSRIQDFELAKLILGGFLGVGALLAWRPDNNVLLICVLCACFGVLSVLGAAVTARHRYLFKEKMDAIRQLEAALNIDGPRLFPKSKLPGWFNTQLMLLIMYVMSACVFVVLALVAFWT